MTIGGCRKNERECASAIERERERGKREQSGGYDDGDDDKRIEKQQQAKQCGRRGDIDDVTVNCCCYCFMIKKLYIYTVAAGFL